MNKWTNEESLIQYFAMGKYSIDSLKLDWKKFILWIYSIRGVTWFFIFINLDFYVVYLQCRWHERELKFLQRKRQNKSGIWKLIGLLQKTQLSNGKPGDCT